MLIVRILVIFPVTIVTIVRVKHMIVDDDEYKYLNVIYPTFVEIIIMSRGFIYVLIFILDEQLRLEAYRICKKILGISSNVKDTNCECVEDAFLYSSLNMELVCAILNGI